MKRNCYMDAYLPLEAEVVHLIQESPSIFTLSIRFTDAVCHERFLFAPGQFNMVYLYGVGEVAISIVSDPNEKDILRHTIRAVGRVTRAMQKLKPGDRIGIRGPFGHGWPLHEARNKDVLIITGGLGCAPTVAVINYIIERRNQYGQLTILQGVKHSEDFIFRKHYDNWSKSPRTEVRIAADVAGPTWPWLVGHVTSMLDSLEIDTANTIVMMCGPEIMMQTAISHFSKINLPEENIYLSLERNMECGIGECGHCQYGGLFVCKDGPVFSYPQIKALFKTAGF